MGIGSKVGLMTRMKIKNKRNTHIMGTWLTKTIDQPLGDWGPSGCQWFQEWKPIGLIISIIRVSDWESSLHQIPYSLLSFCQILSLLLCPMNMPSNSPTKSCMLTKTLFTGHNIWGLVVRPSLVRIEYTIIWHLIINNCSNPNPTPLMSPSRIIHAS